MNIDQMKAKVYDLSKEIDKIVATTNETLQAKQREKETLENQIKEMEVSQLEELPVDDNVPAA